MWELKKNFALIELIERIQNQENSDSYSLAFLEKEREVGKKSVLRIRDPDLSIPDLGSRIQKQQQKRGVKKNRSTFFCSPKNHKIENDINFELMKKKVCANLQRIKELCTQKFVINLSKIWVWDSRSGIRYPISKFLDPEKTYPESRGQKGIGSRISDLRNTAKNE